jgi:hypothetical protein
MLPIYCCEFINNAELRSKIFQVIEPFDSLRKKNYFQNISQQPFRFRSIIEIYLYKLLEVSRSDQTSLTLSSFEFMLEMILNCLGQPAAQDYQVKE